jgi:hypothetical protein
MSKKKVYEYEGRKYAFIEDKEQDECERCALKDKCHDEDGLICTDLLGISNDNAVGRRFEEVNEDALTEEKAYDDYQERSKTANDRGEQLAWAFIVLLAGMMIGNHGYLEYYVGAACGLAYLLLSMIQSAWQTIAIWIIKNRIKRDNLTIEDYPEWVGGWAWVFWYTKIGLLTIGTIYVAYRFVSPLFDL